MISREFLPILHGHTPIGLAETENGKIEDSKGVFFRYFDLSEHDSRELTTAYTWAEEGHSTQVRENGGRYFAHLLRVAEKLIKMGILDAHIISLALMHDLLEDTTQLANSKTQLYAEWRQTLTNSLKTVFNETMVSDLQAITKLPIDLPDIELVFENKNFALQTDENDAFKRKRELKQIRDAIYYDEQLLNASIAVILVKVCDNIDNLSTLIGLPLEKRRRQIEKTLTVLLPLFKAARARFSQTAGIKKEYITYLDSFIDELESIATVHFKLLNIAAAGKGLSYYANSILLAY